MIKLVVHFALMLIVSGCASVAIDRSAADFDDTKYTADLNTCRGGHILASTFETVKYSAVGGAFGAAHGLGHIWYVDSMAALVIGAVTGGVLGAGAGVYQGVKDRETEIESCLRRKGYTIANPAS